LLLSIASTALDGVKVDRPPRACTWLHAQSRLARRRLVTTRARRLRGERTSGELDVAIMPA